MSAVFQWFLLHSAELEEWRRVVIKDAEEEARRSSKEVKRVKAREGNKAAAGENTLDLVSFLALAGYNGCSCKFVGEKESRPYGT